MDGTTILVAAALTGDGGGVPNSGYLYYLGYEWRKFLIDHDRGSDSSFWGNPEQRLSLEQKENPLISLSVGARALGILPQIPNDTDVIKGLSSLLEKAVPEV